MKPYSSLLIAVIAAGSSALSAAEIQVPQDHPKIQDAIDAAKSGDTIIVAPGRYEERIKLTPGITVRSKGADGKGKLGLTRAEASIIDGGGDQGKSPGVEMAEGATLDGFTVTNVGIYDEKKWQKNWEEKGANQSHEHIGGFGVPGIAVTGVTCTIRNNIVHHIGTTGIAIRGEKGKRCSPLVYGNVCYRNMGGGIGSMKGSKAFIINNICFENFYAGIGHDNASPIVADNECYGNIRAGIGISESACPVVQNNRCYKNRRAGIGIRTDSTTRPIVQNNDCFENGMSGIGIDEEAEPYILNNQCHDNKLAGIGSSATLIENTIEGGGIAGIMVQGKATLTKNTITGSKGVSGIWIHGKGEAILSGNQISGYKKPVNDQSKSSK